MASPFDFEHADPWANQFIDVESINAAITDAIIQRVAHVRNEAAIGTMAPAHSMLVLGPAGTGKTHLFARLRRALGPKATFVHIRPDLGVQTTPRHVLAHITSSLQRETAFLETRQLDVLVGAVLAAVQGRGGGPLMHLDDYRRATAATRQRLVDAILDRFEALAVDGSLDYLELLLRVPLAERTERQAAYAWLSGREPSEAQLARLGRRGGLEDTEVLPALRTLAVTAALGGPLVLVFDQLENLIDAHGPPDRILAYGTLVSELVDSVRGLTVVQMALDTEWLHGIQPVLGESQKTRVQMQTALLALPTAAQRETLLRRWVAELTDGMAAFPGPFDAAAVRRWCEAADMTPRALMIACRRALAGEDAAALDNEEVAADALDTCLARHWEEHLRAARAEIFRVAEQGTSIAHARVVGSLMALLPLTDGVVTSVSKPDYVVEVRAGDAQESGRRGSIVVLQQAHPMSVVAALRRAVALSKRQAVLVVRDRGLPFRPTWRACEEYRRTVLAQPGSAWLDLDHESLARALAAHDFLASATSQDLAGPLGHPVERGAARGWLAAWMASQDDPLNAAALGVLEPVPRPQTEPPTSPRFVTSPPPLSKPPLSPPPLSKPPLSKPPLSKPPLSKPPTPTRGALDVVAQEVGAVRCLEALRVASLERVVHEVRRDKPEASRENIDDELRSAAGRVRWLGNSILAIGPRTEP